VGAGIDIDKEPEVLQRVTEEMMKLRNGEFTDKELELARMTLMRSLNGIQDSQSAQADYYFNQHLSTKRYRVEDTLEAIARVDRDAVIRSAIGIGTDVVYFLTGKEEAAE